ncbi:MAG TPA: glycosyltransferase family 1 protein [candidate division WOR-3 bacterium]|uniref:Glycosyltransferase family 1 protein n=1 Tax=candidate division WOR-3 bacterium TaxID=2052148 RepID=A0A7C0ZDN4_UNCW3|nr:glycosyltransferase family 1 protein [candidate division WOR-3 bacterium]
MKTIQMMAKLERGGAQKILISLAENFDGLIISGMGGELFNAVRKNFGDRHIVIKELKREISPIDDILAIFRVREVLKNISKNHNGLILHTHGSKAGVIGALAPAGLKSVRVVHTAHGFAIHPYNSIIVNLVYLWLERLASMFRDLLIFPCETTRMKALMWKIGKEKQYRVVLNGVEIKKKSHSKSRKIIIGTVANFKPQKNPLLWADVVEEVLKRRDVKFVYCGGGPLFDYVRERFRDEKRVILTGWVDNPYTYMKDFSIFFLPSRWEGLPLALLEAMSLGIPPVVSNIDGNAEVVQDGETGFLCPLDDVECYVEKLLYLIDHPLLRSKIGGNAEKVITKRYTMEKMLNGYRDIYKEVAI